MALLRNTLIRSFIAQTKISRHLHSTNVLSTESMSRPTTSEAANLMDIGTRSIFNTDHDTFREAARKFFRNEMLPHTAKWEAEGCCDRNIWNKAGEQGLLGVNTSAEHGGIGGTYLDAAIVMEEQSYAGISGPAFSVHSDIVMPYISHYGSEEQIKNYITGLTEGKIVSAIAMTEPDAGSDLQGMKTFARKDGSDYILNGSKIFITNGWLADLVLVAAITDKNAKSKAYGMSLFLVDVTREGFRKGWLMKKMGLHASDTAALFFDDVRLPASCLVGEENKGFLYLMQQLPQERLNIAVHGLAHTELMFEITRDYVLNRKAFGKPLAALQTVQHKLAEMKTKICVTRAFVDQCIVKHASGTLDSAAASMAKYWTTDLENAIAYDCVQLHGGSGYLADTPIARSYVNARVQPIYGGSNEIMKELIARTIVGKKA